MPPSKLPAGLWRRFCARVTDVFYRRNEVSGTERVPEVGPVILAANHVNALVDALVVQSAIERPVHPIARSGLFRNPFLRPILRFIQAVPIQRRRPARGEDEPAKPGEEPGEAPSPEQLRVANEAAFETLYSYLEEGRLILIFPEGQSHSDPSLRPLKTGAARLALGHLRRTGQTPVVLPVGLTFTQKGRFRSDVLVQVGEEVTFRPVDGEDEEQAVRRYTDEILEGLRAVTLNVDSWQDLSLMRSMQHFFTLRHSRREERPSLRHRFRSYQRLIAAHRALRGRFPERVEILRDKLQRFQDLCRRYGVRDYQLELRYTPGTVARFGLRSLLFLVFVFPLALWGLLHSAIPYLATRQASRLSARGRDQYDTAGVLFGLLFFALFWGAQTFFVHWRFGAWPAVAYAASLPLTAAVALRLGYQRKRILEEVRVFLLFVRRRRLQAFLRTKREELEVELAHMARLAKRTREEGLSRGKWPRRVLNGP